MASEVLVKKSLALTFEEGVDEKGEPITKRYSYSNIKIDATPQNLYDTAQAIAGLSQGTALDATTINTNDLF
jgi:hypothetical protein